MITVRQIERLWNARSYPRLFNELFTLRPECTVRLQTDLETRAAAAAISLIRLEELNQSHTQTYSTLLKALIAHQHPDGSWTDPLTTALCLRALLQNEATGDAIERALAYLADLQKPEGIWPAVPIRRLPADAYVSAFILFQLGPCPRFRASVRFADAIHWFEQNEANLDAPTRQLWHRAALRCHARQSSAQPVLIWS